MSAVAVRGGAEMLKLKRWAVVGRGSNEIVVKLLGKLAAAGKQVSLVDTSSGSAPGSARSLSDIPGTVDVVNLCANAKVGKTVLEEMVELGVNNIFVQPGAESPELRREAEKVGVSWHEGCVLVECRE
eukprot:TRINITY_DN76717_c0_g1_i1.p3 TRINITY_DN76717_c0_g1~~TRINITY_DN76717_c0_g1_i1.p3  ORF type:complete len:128 (-),score=36.65 TRINITY_DN76717_c0_g1_i1:137-520(-)